MLATPASQLQPGLLLPIFVTGEKGTRDRPRDSRGDTRLPQPSRAVGRTEQPRVPGGSCKARPGVSEASKPASSSFPVFYYQLNLAWRGFSPHIPLAHKRLKNQQNHCLCLKGGDEGEKNSMF